MRRSERRAELISYKTKRSKDLSSGGISLRSDSVNSICCGGLSNGCLHSISPWISPPCRADFIQDEEIQGLIEWRHPFDNPPQQIEFTESERSEMLKLPRKECTLSPWFPHVFLNLVYH